MYGVDADDAGDTVTTPPVEVLLECPGWRSGPVLWPGSFRRRWKGLRPEAAGRSMLFATRSVHGFGMRHGLRLVALDAELVVLSVRVLEPARVVWLPRATFVLEMPLDHPQPPPGVRLSMSTL
jgi:hypothetical protein